MAFDHETFRRGERLEIVVGGGKDGERLDSYLCSRFSHLSRAKMQRIIRSQGVEVNGTLAKPSRRVYMNDLVAFDLPDKELLAEDIPLEIIYEDADIIVINKQAGLLVHPAKGNSCGTILNGLAYYAGDEFTPDIVHRLDRNTSGVLIVSKNADANTFLSNQFAERSTEKKYLAVVHGAVEQKEGKIEEPISTNDCNEQYYVTDEGRYALTYYKRLAVSECGKYSLLEVDIKTGRTHQIRVHLSHMRHPIVADTLYGGEPLRLPAENGDQITLERCALHSYKLQVVHPASREKIEFTAPLKPDMAIIAKHLFDYHFGVLD